MTFYRDRLDALPLTFVTALGQDVVPLASAIFDSGELPVITIGSGGSLVTAELLARTIERKNGVVARAMTPLEFIANPVLAHRASVWLLSAEGANPDILAALSAAARAEPAQLNVICNKLDSALVANGRTHHARTFTFPMNDQKDGFLATHSLILTSSMIARAEADGPNGVPDGRKSPPGREALSTDGAALFSVETLFVLYDPALAEAAKLMETNLWEAAVLNVEAVDLRNFAHGRHLWAAKHGCSLGILALLTDCTETLWAEIDRELPKEVRRMQIVFNSLDPALKMLGLWSAMEATDEAGCVRGVDPGRPGVPDFGRRIYHSPALLQVAANSPAMTPALRKLMRDPGQNDLSAWQADELRARERFHGQPFDGLVLDYDGTIVWSDDRRARPATKILNRLLDLLRAGSPVGIATGRGDSVGSMLRSCIPKDLWPLILVGYYNGGLCLGLSETVDRSSLLTDPALDCLLERLKSRLPAGDQIREQVVQLCITSRRYSVPRLRDIILEQIALEGLNGLTVLVSGHSVDVLRAGVDKRNVPETMAARFGHNPPTYLCIGDSGAYPGNDYLLLRTPFGLSVDQVSSDPDSCWNLLPAGVRGPNGLAFYLEHSKPGPNGFLLDLMTL